MSIDSTITKITDAILTLAKAVDRLADAQGQTASEPTVNNDPPAPETAPTQSVEPEPTPAPTETAPVQNEPAEVTFDDARKAVIETTQTKGRDVMAAILSDMGASNIKELSEDQYPELIKRCEGA